MTLDLHIGAHKTATTFIQQTLRKNVDVLEAAGTRFLSPREFRYMHEENWNEGEIVHKHSLEKNDPESAAIALDPSRKLLISDENLLGRSVPFYHANTLYPDIGARFEMLKALLPCAPDTIYLSIRGYRTYYPALYYQFASMSNFLEINDVLQDRMVAKERRWPQIVEDIRAVFPISKIKIWLYEGFAENPLSVLKLLVGDVPLHVNTRARPRPTATGSAYDAWVAALKDPNSDPKLIQRFAQWVNVSGFEAKENDQSLAERFWRDQDVSALDGQYASDVAALMEAGYVVDLEELGHA